MPESALDRGPFGNPDGSRADIDVDSVFIGFSSFARFGGLASKNSDLTSRVFVGRKGSGKTIYLRRIQAYCSSRNDLYATSVERDIPQTRDIVNLCHMLSVNTVTNTWQLIWRRAIFRALYSLICPHGPLSDFVSDTRHKQLISSRFSDILPDFIAPVTIYSQVTDIIRSYFTRDRLDKYLSHPSWATFEGILRRALHDLPPIAFFIDSIDDELKHAPMEWHRCQKGLFYAVMHLLQDQDFGGRLHVIISIRDIVYASILHGEHSTRYIGDSHIRVLEWTEPAIDHFVAQKLAALPDSLRFPSKTGAYPKNFSEWLGNASINNKVRKIEEPTDKYIYRHTRMLPRDIIIFGNKIAPELYNAKESGLENVPEERIRRAVSECSTLFGNEQLEICANHLATMFMPHRAVAQGLADVYTGSSEYISGMRQSIINLISDIGTDRFRDSDKDKWNTKFNETMGSENLDIFSILYQNGILGWKGANSTAHGFQFMMNSDASQFKLPTQAKEFVFHSSMIDVAGLKPKGKEVVYFR